MPGIFRLTFFSFHLKVTFDDVRRLLRDHDGRGIEVSTDDAGHDAGVNHPEPLQSPDPALCVHHRHVVPGAAHLAGARGVVVSVTHLSDPLINLIVSLYPSADKADDTDKET